MEFATNVDLPFLPAPDVVLDVPVPPSVNRLCRISYANRPLLRRWKKTADMMLMASGQYRQAKAVKGPFELHVVLDERRCRADPDNVIKVAIDFLKRIELITDDSPKYARQIVIKWGEAPEGCRLILRGAE